MVAVATQTVPVVDLPMLPLWFEVLWMTINCGFGAAIARSRSTPVFGTLFAGVAVGLGGGMARDVLLGLEPAAISGWFYLPCGVLGAIAGALLMDHIVGWPLPALTLHGVTLGFLVGIGVQKSIVYGAPWFSAMALGVITASFGGMVADVIVGQRAGLASQAHWVASALCVGAVVYWSIDQAAFRVSLDPAAALWLAALPTVAIIASLRVISVVRNWPSPDWPTPKPHPAG